jgi:hypothetical protein
MEKVCSNSYDGLHHEGPPDFRDHTFCIYCGQPLIKLNSIVTYGGWGWYILAIILILAAANIILRSVGFFWT